MSLLIDVYPVRMSGVLLPVFYFLDVGLELLVIRDAAMSQHCRINQLEKLVDTKNVRLCIEIKLLCPNITGYQLN